MSTQSVNKEQTKAAINNTAGLARFEGMAMTAASVLSALKDDIPEELKSAPGAGGMPLSVLLQVAEATSESVVKTLHGMASSGVATLEAIVDGVRDETIGFDLDAVAERMKGCEGGSDDEDDEEEEYTPSADHVDRVMYS